MVRSRASLALVRKGYGRGRFIQVGEAPNPKNCAIDNNSLEMHS